MTLVSSSLNMNNKFLERLQRDKMLFGSASVLRLIYVKSGFLKVCSQTCCSAFKEAQSQFKVAMRPSIDYIHYRITPTTPISQYPLHNHINIKAPLHYHVSPVPLFHSIQNIITSLLHTP
jgi:hypothetical protein